MVQLPRDPNAHASEGGTLFALKRAVATYREILDLLNTAVVAVTAVSNLDADIATFRVSYLNQSAESLFGISEQRAIGKPLHALLDDAHTKDAALAEVLATGQPFTKRAVSLYLPDGPVQVDYSIAPLAESELLLELEVLDRFMRINRDDQNAALQETSRKLARGLAHEVKNPLGGIRGAAQLLERQLTDPDQREYTSVIINEADRLRDLVDRILGPNDRPKLESVNVHEVIEHVVRLLDAECPARVRFERDYDPSVPDIEGDRDKLIQAVLNVVKNAIAALGDVAEPCITLQTRIVRQFTIGSRRHKLVANLNFIDNGPGIPSDIADRIFYPMISGRADGSGLGLAITQTIVGQHGGLIQHESEPGHTQFSFYLPLEQDPQ